MQTVDHLDKIPPFSSPIALTIGTFDGIHLGHQYLFRELKKRGTACVLTFSNHPSEILTPDQPTPLLSTLEQKLSLLETHGIDLAIVIPFTAELAQLSYKAFLQLIHSHLPFSSLILGKGAALGYKAEGSEDRIREIASELSFEPIYLPLLTVDGEVVSSTKIRELFKQVNQLLGGN